MKVFFKSVIALTLLATSATATSGDLGGGGSMAQSRLVLTAEQRAALLRQGNPQSAFALWLNQMNDQQKVEALKNVFSEQILPQLQQ